MFRFPIPSFNSCSCAMSFSRTGGILQHTESVFVFLFSIFNFQSSFLSNFLCRVYWPWLYRGLFNFDSLFSCHAFFFFISNDFGILIFPSWSPVSLNGEGRRLHFIDPLLDFIPSHGHFYLAPFLFWLFFSSLIPGMRCVIQFLFWGLLNFLPISSPVYEVGTNWRI